MKSPSEFALHHPAGAGILADWVDVTIPAEMYDDLTADGGPIAFQSGDKFYPVVEQFRRGRQGVNVRVLASFPNETIYGWFVKKHVDVPPFMLHPSFDVDRGPILLLVPGFAETKNVPVLDQTSPLHREPIRSNAAEMLWRIPYGDFNRNQLAIIWVRIRSMHPVADIAIRWTARRTEVQPAKFFSDWQNWDECDYFPIDGFASGLPEMVDVGAAPTQWYRATATPASEESSLERDLRATASHRWPTGYYYGYQTHVEEDGDLEYHRWLTLGIRPQATGSYAKQVVQRCNNLLANGKFYDARPNAQALSANQAGTQRFGLAEGGLLDHYGPDVYRAMRLIAGDEELRSIHFYQDDGEPITFKSNPGLRTHNRRIDIRNTKDNLGYPTGLPRVNRYAKRTTDDEQHTDDLGIDAFLALWDDPALEETRRMMVHLDSLDTQTWNGRTNSAARGIGRPLLSLATAAWLFEGDETGDKAAMLCSTYVTNILNTWEGKSVPADRPIKPIATIRNSTSWALTNPDTGEKMRAAAPYEHATVIAGLLAAAEVVDKATRPLALGLATMLTKTIMSWAYRDTLAGLRWPFIVGVLDGDQDGHQLPESWRDVERPEFHMTHDEGGSWTTWTAVAAYAVPYLLKRVPGAESVLQEHLEEAQEIIGTMPKSGHDDRSYLAARFCAIGS